jgi:hypothetical protein
VLLCILLSCNPLIGAYWHVQDPIVQSTLDRSRLLCYPCAVIGQDKQNMKYKPSVNVSPMGEWVADSELQAQRGIGSLPRSGVYPGGFMLWLPKISCYPVMAIFVCDPCLARREHMRGYAANIRSKHSLPVPMLTTSDSAYPNIFTLSR